jgi:uncharacterized lipoprotein YehR (DUF1307 family)
MKLFKSLILTLIVTLILTTTLIFCQDKNDNTRLVPSGEVVGLNIELKYPYVYQRLSEDEKDVLKAELLELERIIQSFQKQLKQ